MNFENGQSLVQVLVAFAIMGILFSGLASLMNSQWRQTKALTEKFAVLDFSRVITSLLANSATCNDLLLGTNLVGSTAALTFDATAVNTTHPKIIHLLQIAGVAGGGGISEPSTAPFIDSNNGIELNVTSPTTANLVVNFDQTKLTQSLKGLSFPILLQSSGPINNMTINGCAGSSPAIRFEGGQNVGGSTCTGNYSGGFCDSNFIKHIVFATPFSTIPKVIVSGRGNSIHTYCACCAGASDQAFALPINISQTGFDVLTSISPFGTNCTPYENQSVQMDFDWMAFGQ